MRVSTSFLSATVLLALTFSDAEAEDGVALMSGADLEKQIVGNTMFGQYANGEDWREYFDPTGEIRGMDEKHGPYTARYEITHNFMCFDYPWEGTDWCASLSVSGDRITFYKNDEKVTSIPHTQLLRGNPYNF
jgi:hypothetical protein